MLTIYVSPRNHQITTADGQIMTVKGVFVREAGGFVSLYDFEPPTDLKDVQIVLVRKYLKNKILQLPAELKQAMVHFFREYHAKINMGFDCYAFANLVKGVKVHKVPYMVAFWDTFRMPWRIPLGSIVFFQSGETTFHHAAIYIGSGLYISVYGAGGDFEVATLKQMKRDYRASEVVVAQPKEEPLL
jgi:hypothetical protein